MRRSTSRRVLAALFALMVALGGTSLVTAATSTARDRAAGETTLKPGKKACKKGQKAKKRRKCRKKGGGGGQVGGTTTGAGAIGGGAIGGGVGPGDTAPLRPTDYIAQADTLSQPDFPETIREVVTLEAFDGEQLYLEITKPDPAVYGERRLPVILEASPYHGTLADREGTRMFPDPLDAEGQKVGLTGYFAPRGYAVAMFDLRGTGRSTGCLDHLGQNDAKDLKTVIEWLAGQPWSNGRVGMTGHSYVGSTPSVAAAQAPEGLVTIVPSAGLASMYDHQFNHGVPWNLQWVGPMYAYEALAIQRDMPPGSPPLPLAGGGTGDNFENAPNPQFGCGMQSSAAISGSGQVTGQYEQWHAQRDWREGATLADIPIFIIHGANDNAARIPAAEWFFGERFMRPGDKVWLGQWDHGSTNGRCADVYGFRALHPTCRFDQMKYAVHAWFDKHLMQRDVDTGPPVEVFLNGETPIDVTQVVDPETTGGKVYVADGWKAPEVVQDLFLDASDAANLRLSSSAPEAAGNATFASNGQAVLAGSAGSLTFTSDPVTEDTLLVGLPELRLDTSLTTGQITHLTTRLDRVRVTEDAEGSPVVEREAMNFCGIQPQLRGGVDQVAPVVPGEVMSLQLQCFTMAQWIPAGQSLELVISTRSPHHATYASADQQITISTGADGSRYELPVVPSATLYEDVPLRETYPVLPPPGPAQAGYSGSVIVPAPGGGEIVEPVTAAAYEFDVLDADEAGTPYDNAKMEIVATPMVAGDLDLYLQRETTDGWQEITAAETGSTENEILVAGRLPEGHYRVLVHNWAAVAGEVSVEIAFFNRDGVSGDGEAEGSQSEALIVNHAMFGYLPQA